jgi:hypothetical protein
MTNTKYESAGTGLLLVDPYNDFLSEGGQVLADGQRWREFVNQTEKDPLY